MVFGRFRFFLARYVKRTNVGCSGEISLILFGKARRALNGFRSGRVTKQQGIARSAQGIDGETAEYPTPNFQ